MATSITSTRFASVVRTKLLDNKVAGVKPDSVRGLARVMAKGDEPRAATYRRSLFKWMADGEPHPSRGSRAIVADALGIERQALDDDDDAEAAQMAPAAAGDQMVNDLIRRLQPWDGVTERRRTA